MKRFLVVLAAVAVVWGGFLPLESSAALVWRKGEGWSWEREGVSTGKTPQEQLAIARALTGKKDYSSAVAAYRRVIRRWPTSSAVEDARMGLAESYAALDYYYRAYKEYQQLIEKNPSSKYFETALQRQFEIGNLFLAGQRDKAWGIRWFPARDKAIEIFEQIVKNGPYSKVGPEAQFRIGVAQEMLKDYVSAVRAYEKVTERYPNLPLAETAQFQIGAAYMAEAGRYEYDQNAANQAIAAFTDFLVRYPNTPKTAEAEADRTQLKLEQAKGLFRVGQFYEKNKEYKAALIYYNAVIEENPKSDWAANAKTKVLTLNARLQKKTATP